jgi:diguanylate cyclase (GGDEF)-like protein
MESIRNQLLDCFEKYAEDDTRLIQELNALISQEGNQVCSFIFQILTNLDLSPSESAEHWQKVVAHCQTLGSSLGREVNLLTAVCDYFCSVNKSLHNPKIIEIHLFEKAAKSSTFDSLTGLLNRNAFDDALQREISRAKRHDSNLSLLFLDLDDFKQINDSFGHMAGDEVLKSVAQTIMTEKRSEDIAARYGGEEVTIVLPETSKAEGWLLGERIRKKLEETTIIFDDQAIKITLSGGLASYPIDANDGTALLKNADKAMYRAKSFGKNNISLYSMDKRRNIRIEYSTSVELSELGFGEKQTLNAMTKSLSIGGIMLESVKPIGVGIKIQMKIAINDAEPILVIGNVIREEKNESGSFDISITFIESDTMVKNEISNYLIKHLEDFTPLPDELPHQPS